jgi:hypothetical protein
MKKREAISEAKIKRLEVHSKNKNVRDLHRSKN